MQDKKILIVNDDGIESDGIVRLAKAAKKFGQVCVVAPESQRSAMSHCITLRDSITANEYAFPVEGVKAYAISGTPGDCVRLGVLNLMEGKPDLVFSGINYGYNIATDIQYSATAGAAFEGAFQGVKSIAFSEDAKPCHEITDAYLEKIIEELMGEPLDYGEIWNVNFPGIPLRECKGILRDRKMSHNVIFADRYNEKKLSDGSIEFTVEGIYCDDAEEGTDFKAVLEGYISIGKVSNVR